LFKFDSTAFAQAYRDEQLAAGREGGALTDRPGETQTLCPAGLENAKAIIFRLTSKFIAEVEGTARAMPKPVARPLVAGFESTSTITARLSDKVRTVLLDREDAWSRSDQNADAKFQLPPSTVPLLVSSLKTPVSYTHLLMSVVVATAVAVDQGGGNGARARGPLPLARPSCPSRRR
ncbi:hypothetical protein T4E_9394, partial [Trichinella pseudospiralis]